MIKRRRIGKDRKDNIKGHAWLQRERTDMMTARRTGNMTEIRKGMMREKDKNDVSRT